MVTVFVVKQTNDICGCGEGGEDSLNYDGLKMLIDCD